MEESRLGSSSHIKGMSLTHIVPQELNGTFLLHFFKVLVMTIRDM